MRIAVLGDYRLGISFCENVNIYNEKNGSEHIVRYFKTSDNFKKQLQNKCQYDTIIISLDSNTIDPDELLHFIRKEMLNDEINIFVASENEFGSLKLIKYNLLDFLTLPLDYKSVSDCLELCEFGRENNFFSYYTSRTEHKLPISKIVYMESVERKVVIHTKNDNVEFYGKLSDYKKHESLKGFIDIHRSFLVNPIYIEHIDQKTLTVTGNKKLPISRYKLKNVIDLISQ